MLANCNVLACYGPACASGAMCAGCLAEAYSCCSLCACVRASGCTGGTAVAGRPGRGAAGGAEGSRVCMRASMGSRLSRVRVFTSACVCARRAPSTTPIELTTTLFHSSSCAARMCWGATNSVAEWTTHGSQHLFVHFYTTGGPHANFTWPAQLWSDVAPYGHHPLTHTHGERACKIRRGEICRPFCSAYQK